MPVEVTGVTIRCNATRQGVSIVQAQFTERDKMSGEALNVKRRKKQKETLRKGIETKRNY